MTLYPVPLDQRHAQTLQNMQGAIKTLQARTMGIDSGIPLMSLPGQVDPGYPADGSNPMVYVNGSAELTGPYEYLASYFPVAGDTVTMLPVQQSYIVLGAGGPAVNTKLPGNLEVDGITVLEQTLTVIGAATVDGVVTTNAGCKVTNGLATDELEVGGQAAIGSNAFVGGQLQIAGPLWPSARFRSTTRRLSAGTFSPRPIPPSLGMCFFPSGLFSAPGLWRRAPTACGWKPAAQVILCSPTQPAPPTQ